MRSDQPGPLDHDERALLDALLAHDFPGVEELRTQADWVEAKRGCECGCGTIDFVLTRDDLPASGADSPAPAQGFALGFDGEEVGGLLLFLQDGYLASLEVYAYEDPQPLPSVESVRWWIPGSDVSQHR
mgnify:CR=1 FL=1